MLNIRSCARDGCDEAFVLNKYGPKRQYCSKRCLAQESHQREREERAANPVSRARVRKSRAVARVKLDARVCRGCDQQFDPLRVHQSHCLTCRPVAEEFRRCDECQKPFRIVTKASRFCDVDCRAQWHDRMHGSESPVDGFEDDEEDEAVVLEMEDAPRRKRLFETLVRFGHPVWNDAELPPSAPPRRKTYAEEKEELYPEWGAGPTRLTHYGR